MNQTFSITSEVVASNFTEHADASGSAREYRANRHIYTVAQNFRPPCWIVHAL